MRKPVVVTAYFSGVALSIAHYFIWIGSFLHKTTLTTPDTAFKHGFDGTRLTHGWLGALFGVGIDSQCRTVALQVRDLIQQGNKVVLNCYGHSRGGATALLLAKMLGQIHSDHLEINLVLHDPVPGNLISTTYLDTFGMSLANQAMDLSQCKNLNSVLSLYTQKPSPAYFCCAPILPIYPAHCQVEEDVIPGDHTDTQAIRGGVSAFIKNPEMPISAKFSKDAPSLMSFVRIRTFLFAHGTSFNLPLNLYYQDTMLDMLWDMPYARSLDITKLLPIYAAEKERLQHSTSFIKACHTPQPKEIVTDLAPSITYLNRHHKQLATGQPVTSTEDCCLKIKPAKISWIGRIAKHIHDHPYLSAASKFFLIGTAVAVALYFSGGLAALPLLAPFIAPLGLAALAAAVPLCALATAAIWYGCFKPIIASLLNITCLTTPDDQFATAILQKKYPGQPIKSSAQIYRGLNATPLSATSLTEATAIPSAPFTTNTAASSLADEERRDAQTGYRFKLTTR